MRWIDRLEPRWGRFAVPHLTLAIVTGSAMCFIFGSFSPSFLYKLPLVPELVVNGEPWRLLTFIFYPLDTHPFFAFFTYYLFYVMGTALESAWGEFKYTLYIGISCFLTATLAFLNPSATTTNYFIGSSIFLAFAFLYPDFELYFFFVLPIKVKYIAMLTWALFVWFFIAGDGAVRMSLAAAVINFFIFFGADIFAGLRGRGASSPAPVAMPEIAAESNEPFHLCRVCGLTEIKDPKMDFRICAKCGGGAEYCQAHLSEHAHS